MTAMGVIKNNRKELKHGKPAHKKIPATSRSASRYFVVGKFPLRILICDFNLRLHPEGYQPPDERRVITEVDPARIDS